MNGIKNGLFTITYVKKNTNSSAIGGRNNGIQDLG